ncbi:two-component system response regulator HydG [Catalinimonas alkaloidigena]|uniref:sigma-54-dependent transcriptional regulator n=1 Tax=Catalinimonas alkaloidigena TaxID=1075417 RepID=UPI002405B651|nr:sigma-54 dependent transcriptional regulator [Catalinimonas alkaloidigena]MDF9799891.1 two-component system response regulator HydG [Catalinimonas alkaloidigena]
MEKQDKKILIIDDDTDVLGTARMFLKQFFSQVDTEQNPANINSIVSRGDYHVILLDMNFRRGEHDGREGLYWLERILTIAPQTAVVLITAYGDIELAVEAMKQGAADFVLKPWKNSKLLDTIYKALSKGGQHAPSKDNTEALQAPQMIGQSAVMQKVYDMIDRVAETNANVLILGENGTGKEMVARLLHLKSGRRNKPFVKVDMGAITNSLMESELFGHQKGAFTDAYQDKAGKFELASEGTLFLDEIGNLSSSQQAKLLSVLQNRTLSRVGSNEEIHLNIRLICATNIPLYEMADRKDDGFRQDLLYRINTVEIVVPPLRERKDDLLRLAEHFLDIYGKKYNKPGRQLSKSALKKLEHYHWPGNVRELQHAVERSVILSQHDTLQPEDFAFSEGNILSHQPKEEEALTLDENEKLFIQRALERHQGNVTRTAQALGLTRTALYRRLDKYGL